MALLPPGYISNWYYLVDNIGLNPLDSQKIRIFESYVQTHNNNLSPKTFLQGGIGTKVMEVGGLQWTSSISSPILILNASSTTEVTSVFDLIITLFNLTITPSTQSLLTYFMQSASIKISPDGVNCDLNFKSTVPNPFLITNGVADPLTFIGRPAKNYDTNLSVSFLDASSLPITNVFQIESANIDIEIDIAEKYFIGLGQSPYYAINGYTIKGSVTILATPAEFDYFFIEHQNACDFAVKTFNSTVLQVCGQQLSLGAFSMVKSITRTLTTGNISTVKIDFENFAF